MGILTTATPRFVRYIAASLHRRLVMVSLPINLRHRSMQHACANDKASQHTAAEPAQCRAVGHLTRRRETMRWPVMQTRQGLSYNQHRTGFTLLEMLITAGIFLFGFMAVYALFLIGVEARREAESITRTSLAALMRCSKIAPAIFANEYRTSQLLHLLAMATR